MPTPFTQTAQCVYHPDSLASYASWLRVGFSGKPFSLGGPDSENNPRQTVLDNRQALLTQLQQHAPESSLAPMAIPRQVHGNHIADTHEFDADCEADGLWLKAPGQTGMILTADCAPVLIISPLMRQVLLLHAGWRGTHAQIVRHGITQLLEANPDCPAASLHVVIGPCIQPCCFQVSREVAAQLAESHSLSLDETGAWIHWDSHAPDNPRVSLPELNRQQCHALGVTQIDISSACTHCDNAMLYSYRRGDEGRQGLWAGLLP